MASLPVEGYDQLGNATGLPVASPEPKVPTQEAQQPSYGQILDRLLGTGGQERYQTWPEKMVRDALAAPSQAIAAGNAPNPYKEGSEEWQDFESRRGAALPQALNMAALAGTGGLGGVGAEAGAALGAGPFLRPALKFNEKIYKAPHGGQHLDALPKEMIPEFNRLAMSGEDISHYDFGFMNHKGQFLSREKALDYAIKEGLINPNSEAARAGVLTSTMDLMSDTSKSAQALKALENLKKQGYDIDNPVYHQSNKTFDVIKPSYGTQVWFSNSKDALAGNGASGSGKVATAYLKNKNLANWDQYDKYTTDQLIQQGFNGAQLGNDIVMFEPKDVKIHSWEDYKPSDTSKPGQVIKALEKPSQLNMPREPTLADMKKANITDVLLSTVRDPQSGKMDWTPLAQRKTYEPLVKGYEDLPIAVRMNNGEHLIYDGRHRTVMDINSGADKKKMYVLNAKDYDPANAGRTPAKQKISDDELLKQLKDDK